MDSRMPYLDDNEGDFESQISRLIEAQRRHNNRHNHSTRTSCGRSSASNNNIMNRSAWFPTSLLLECPGEQAPEEEEYLSSSNRAQVIETACRILKNARVNNTNFTDFHAGVDSNIETGDASDLAPDFISHWTGRARSVYVPPVAIQPCESSPFLVPVDHRNGKEAMGLACVVSSDSNESTGRESVW